MCKVKTLNCQKKLLPTPTKLGTNQVSVATKPEGVLVHHHKEGAGTRSHHLSDEEVGDNAEESGEEEDCRAELARQIHMAMGAIWMP